MQSNNAALHQFRCEVRPDWVDYNGHLRDSYYMLIFSLATDALMDQIGMDEAGRLQHQHTLYTLEAHVNYLREVHGGSQVEVRTQLIGIDEKRLHVHYAMYADDDANPVCVSEQLLMNIDTTGARSARFSDTVQGLLLGLKEQQVDLPVPLHLGRVIALRTAKRG